MAGLRRLTEDDVTLWPVQRPPLPYPLLQCPPDAVVGECQRMQTLKMPQQDRDHVRATEGLAARRNPLRPMPESLPLRHRSRRYCHVLAVKQERVLTLTLDIESTMIR